MKRLVYTWTNSHMSFNTKDNFVKQSIDLSKGVVIVVSA